MTLTQQLKSRKQQNVNTSVTIADNKKKARLCGKQSYVLLRIQFGSRDDTTFLLDSEMFLEIFLNVLSWHGQNVGHAMRVKCRHESRLICRFCAAQDHQIEV